jgi:hypothetical protein
VPDLQWDDVKEWFDPYTNGTLPDVIVQDATLTDWATLLGLIRSEGWRSSARAAVTEVTTE